MASLPNNRRHGGGDDDNDDPLLLLVVEQQYEAITMMMIVVVAPGAMADSTPRPQLISPSPGWSFAHCTYTVSLGSTHTPYTWLIASWSNHYFVHDTGAPRERQQRKRKQRKQYLQGETRHRQSIHNVKCRDATRAPSRTIHVLSEWMRRTEENYEFSTKTGLPIQSINRSNP